SLLDDAVALARRWLATAQDEPARASRSTRRLTDLVADPDGLDLAIRFVDRVARPEDDRVAARELAELRGPVRSARAFLGPLDQSLLQAGAVLAPALPGVVVPAARARLRQLVGDLVADAGPDLACHVARLRAEGFRANINL